MDGFHAGADPDDGAATFAQVQDRLRRALCLVPPLAQKVMTARFGLDGNPAMMIEDVARNFSMTRQEVFRMELEIFWKMRCHAAERDVRAPGAAGQSAWKESV